MIYLDYNATTPIDKEVAKEMSEFIYNNFANPSSNYKMGQIAKKAVENSREQVAKLINCSSKEIVFTSCGTESNNMVIKGVAHSFKNKGKHIITSTTEHPSILAPCKYLGNLGYKISYISVDEYGVINLSELERIIDSESILVTIMHANNETGTIQPIKEISEICKKNNVLFHTDAAQSIGKINTDVKKLGIDFLTIAGHKLYAPKGVGALFIKDGIQIEPLIHGASQENKKRAGTENTILNVALGKACEIALNKINNTSIKELTDYFLSKLKSKFGNKIKLNGHPINKLPNTLNISFLGKQGTEILLKLGENIAASTGSACHSGSITISPVLKAMMITPEIGLGAIRFSLGRYTTKAEIDIVLKKLYL